MSEPRWTDEAHALAAAIHDAVCHDRTCPATVIAAVYGTSAMAALDHLRAAGLLVQPGGETRTWSLPPEPGPEVKAVRDRLNAEWERCGRRWRPVGSLGPERFWAEVLAFYGPLTDATQEAQ